MLVLGCGSDDDTTAAPIACTVDESYFGALRDAPEPVLLEDQTPISECLPSDQSAGDQAAVGQTLVAVATELARRARRDPGGQEAVALGYLVGAAERGSATTAGIHQDLIRRLESAANLSRGGPDAQAASQRAYDEGFAAGQETG